MTKRTSNNWIEKIWERKIPQYVGTYLAVGFGIFQFIQVIVTRFNLSDTFQDRYLIIWLALLPAVFILVYFGFQPNGKEAYEKKKWPKYFIGINSIVAIVLSIFLISENENKIEDTTQIVQLIDEDGQDVKAIVPSLKKVKNIACFQFENLTGDTSQDWQGIAMSALLGYSLEQYPEFYVASAYALNSYYDRLGLKSFDIPNTGMQSTIAKKSRNDYFCKVSFSLEQNKYTFSGKLIRTKDGEVIENINISNENLYNAIDEIKEQILNKLQPKNDKDIKVDNNLVLPASALISDNPKAIELLTKSRMLLITNPNQLDDVVNLSKQSVIEDPTCSQCHLNVASPLVTQGKKNEANTYLKKAIKYGASLPKRMQFAAKEFYYSINNNINAAIKLQEFRKEMFPYDFQPYSALLTFYKSEYGMSKAQNLIQEAIDNGNIEKGLLTLFNLQLENEEYSEAEKTLDQFFKQFPERDQDKLRYVTLYENQGKLDKAKEKLLEAEVLDPFNSQIKIRIARVDFKNLKINSAKKRVNDGFKQSTTLTDSLTFLAAKIFFEFKLGEMENTFNSISQYEKYALKKNTLRSVLNMYSGTKSLMYLSIDKPQKAKEIMHDLLEYDLDNKSRYFCGINIQATINGYDNVVDTKSIDCESLFETYGDGFNDYYKVIKLYQVQKYNECITLLEKDDAKVFNLFNEKYFIADIYHKAGLNKKAINILKKELFKKPDEPIYYYKTADLLKNIDQSQSKEYLNKALEFWKNADTNFTLYKRAKDLEERLAM